MLVAKSDVVQQGRTSSQQYHQIVCVDDTSAELGEDLEHELGGSTSDGRWSETAAPAENKDPRAFPAWGLDGTHFGCGPCGASRRATMALLGCGMWFVCCAFAAVYRGYSAVRSPISIVAHGVTLGYGAIVHADFVRFET
eukprot:SAG11_NODE_2130_length_3778_cov_2.150584_2_plen_140_part_00